MVEAFRLGSIIIYMVLKKILSGQEVTSKLSDIIRIRVIMLCSLEEELVIQSRYPIRHQHLTGKEVGSTTAIMAHHLVSLSQTIKTSIQRSIHHIMELKG
jgi:hypothetical protein